MIVYKIRRKDDGLFSNGGAYPSFSKTGKLWKQRGHLTSHLNQVHHRRVYDECEIVTYELSETEIDNKPMAQYLVERDQERERKAQEARERREEAMRQQRYNEYLKLKGEFEK